jgi:hypothetical protein
MTGHPAFQSGRVYLGWQYTPLEPDPGPSPRRPVPPEPEQLNPGWLAAQRREERLLSRPWQASAAMALAGLALVPVLSVTGLLNPALTTLGVLVFAVLASLAVRAIWRGERALRATIAAEARRVAAAREVQESQLFARQEEHARRFRDWQSRQETFAQQPLWYPVALPDQIDRVDVAGGTLAGWSALLTMIAVARLATGGEVTVLDLSEGAVARDLAELATDTGARPLVWVLPGDLPRLDLGVGMPAGPLADVLAATASADPPGQPGPAGAADPARDQAIIERVISALGPGAGIASVTAGLRALAEVGDSRADIGRGLLTTGQLDRIMSLFGRGANDRVVIERALALEARLRALDRLGCDTAPLPPSPLRVIALDRGAAMLGNAVLATYLTVSLTHLLRQAPPGQPWQHTLCLAGAERLRGDVLDRLCDACETTRTGLVLAYRSIPAQVKERLGRGNAALAFMRLGNAEDAKVASEQIGTQHRFVLSQLTDTVGASITGTSGWSYTSTVGTAGSLSVSVSTSQSTGRSRGRGHTRADLAPFGARTGSGSEELSRSTGTSDSESITEGINANTSWGLSTSTAIGANESLARTAQRSREFLVEPHQLQQLPPSAVIVSYASPAGREVVLADANPAILGLPTVSMVSHAEAAANAQARGQAKAQEQERAQARARAAAQPSAWHPPEGETRAGPGPAGPGPAGPGPAAPAPAGTGAGRLWWAGAAARAGAGRWRPPADVTVRGHPGRPPGDQRTGEATPPGGERAAGADPPARPGPPAPVSWRSRQGRPPPNLGPPPEPLDWRRRHRP